MNIVNIQAQGRQMQDTLDTVSGLTRVLYMFSLGRKESPVPLVRIDAEEKRRIVDVAISAARVQSKRSKSKVSPEEAMHRALGSYTLLRKAQDNEIVGGAVLYPDEIADI